MMQGRSAGTALGSEVCMTDTPETSPGQHQSVCCTPQQQLLSRDTKYFVQPLLNPFPSARAPVSVGTVILPHHLPLSLTYSLIQFPSFRKRK